MPKWFDITRSDKFQALPQEEQVAVKQRFFERFMLPELDKDEDLKAPDVKQAIFQKFMSSPDDTGQGYVTSMLGAAGRGFGEMLPGAVEGVGALIGSEGIREAGQDLRSGLESIAPVNPIYAESVPVKLAGVGGQVGSVLATAGAGGAIGKALGGVGAVSKGAQTAALGSAFLQGAAEGRREAEQYGMEGPEAYMRTLAGGAIEAGTEFLPFGMASETALAKRMLTGAPKTTTFLGSVGSEAGEETLGQMGSNIATTALAPIGVETPGITEGALEAGAYGAFGGGLIGGVNALIPTAPKDQTPEQKQWQAEINATPVQEAPPVTPEESAKNAEQGGTPVVTPDGQVTWLPAMSEALRPTQQAAVEQPSDVEQRLEETMRNPALEIAKEVGEASTANLAAIGSEQSAAAMAEFNATLDEIEAKTAKPPVQPSEEAEAPVAEEALGVTPEEESLAAQRRADLLSAAADAAKGKTKAQVSPVVTAMVTPVQAAPIAPENLQSALDEHTSSPKTPEQDWQFAVSMPEGVWIEDGQGGRMRKKIHRIKKSGSEEIEFEHQLFNEETGEWEANPSGNAYMSKKRDGSLAVNNQFPSSLRPFSYTVTSTGEKKTGKPVVVLPQKQPATTQENAVQEQIPDEGVLRQERPEMELQGMGEQNVQPQETATEGQIQEEVIAAPGESEQGTLYGKPSKLTDKDRSQAVSLAKTLQPGDVVETNDGQETFRYKVVVEDGTRLLRKIDQRGDIIEGVREKFLANPARTSSQGELAAIPDGRDTIDVIARGRIIRSGTEAQPTIQVATERDLTKPEQMTPEEALRVLEDRIGPNDPKHPDYSRPDWLEIESRVEEGENLDAVLIDSAKGYLKIEQEREAKEAAAIEATRSSPDKEYVRAQAKMSPDQFDREVTLPELKRRNSGRKIAKDSEILKRLKAMRGDGDYFHTKSISEAIDARLPVNVEAVDAYQITLPEGYVKQGDLYVFQPSSEQSGLGAGAATAPKGVIESPTAPGAGKSLSAQLNAANNRDEAKAILANATLQQVKEAAQEMGYPATGSKSAIVSRLVAAVGSRADAKAIRQQSPQTTQAAVETQTSGVATERDLTKPEQMNPDEFTPIGNPVNQGIFKSKKEASARLAELEDTISKSPQMMGILSEFNLTPSDAYEVAKDTRGRWSLGATHKHRVALAARERLPVSAAAVDTYGIKLPSGYVKQGDLYVFQPSLEQSGLGAGVATERDLSKPEEQPAVKAPPEGKKSLYQIRAAKGRPATDVDGIPTGWKLNEFRDAVELVSEDASKYVVFSIENPSSYGDKMRALIMAENWAIDNPVRAQIEAAPMQANYGAGRVEDVTLKTVKFVHTTKTKPGKGQKTGYYPGTYAYESESGLLPSMEGKKFVGELPESNIYTLKDADQLKKDAADAGFGRHSGNGNAEVKYLQSLGFKAMRRPSMGGTEIIVFDTKDANFQPQTTAAETQTPESLRVDSGAAGVVQSETGKGSILPDDETKETPYKEESSGKVEAGSPPIGPLEGYVRRLMSMFPKLSEVNVVIVDNDAALALNSAGNTNLYTNPMWGGEVIVDPETKEISLLLPENGHESAAAHEVGHLIQKVYFDKADKKTQDAVFKSYLKWLKNRKSQVEKNQLPISTGTRLWHIWDKFLPNSSPDSFIKITKELKGKHTTSYGGSYDISSFGEWFADQVSRWANTDKVPLGIVEEFFKDVYDQIKKLWSAINKHFLPDKSVVDFIHSIANPPAAKATITASTLPFIKVEATGYAEKLNSVRKLLRTGSNSTKAQNEALNDLMAMPLADLQAAFEVVTGIPTKLANKRQLANNVLNEVLAESRNEKLPEADETFRKAEIEAEEEIQRQNAQSLARIFNDKLRTNPVKGTVTTADAEQAIGQLQNSGEVPGAIFTWRGTAKELQRLAQSPAFKKAFPGAAQAAEQGNVEGLFENGMAFVITDQVVVTDLDRARALVEGTTPTVAAVKRVISHENYHKGVALLSPKDQAKLVSLLRKLFPAAELDDLAKSYKQYADWRTNRASEYALLEEKMQKAIEEMDEVPRDGLLRELVDFLKAIWRKWTGQPKGEPKLRDLKDVVRLLRSTLKDAHKAQANRTANGGRVMMSLPAFRNFVPAVNLNGRIETGTSHYEAWLKHAIRQIPSHKKDGLSDSEVKDLADKWLVDHPEAMANSMTKEGFVTDEGYLNRQDSLKKFLALGGKQRLDPGEVRDWLDSADVESARMSLGTNLIDAEYLAAVQVGDMEKAQRMVDEAAKAAGYNVGPVWHGSRSKDRFSVFDKERSGKSGYTTATAKLGFFFSPQKQKTDLYGPNKYAAYLKVENPLRLTSSLSNSRNALAVDDIAEQIEEGGHDAVMDQENRLKGDPFFEIAVFNPSQIKSADPVTYDDAGNVIPLSQRFQPTSPDIRFSLATPVEYSSTNNELASSAQQTARNIEYTPRQLEVHFAVRKAYDAMPKDNGVAVPLFELFDKTKELVPDLNAQEFSEIVQGLYDDNAALLNTAKKMLHHGTPHKVDRFLLEKIGTGEGAQAYGWGLYFAEKESVAKSYRDILSESDSFIGGENFDPETNAKHLAASRLVGATPEEAIQFISDDIKYAYDSGDKSAIKQAELLKEALDLIKGGYAAEIEEVSKGNLYTVELLPDESEFLDWDKPLAEQSEKVQGVFYELLADLTGRMKQEMEGKEQALQSEAAKLGLPRKPVDVQGMIDLWLNDAVASGAGLYDLVRGIRGKGATPPETAKAASEYLASLGIPGIKYLDAGSRSDGDGSRNFVVFDENSVRIVKENEQPVFPIFNRDSEPASSVVILPGKGMASLGTALSPEEYARHAELEAKNKAGIITPEETKEAEKLVEKAARRAGYNVGPVWHLSQEDFNEFSPEFRSQFGTVGPGFYFSGKPSKYLAKKRPVQRKFFLKISKPLPLDKEGMPKRTFMEMLGRTMDAAVEKKMEGGVSDGIINSRMMEGTYDGIYTVWNSEQIKSADPFTGVPLEQRFDVTSPDIRFSYGAADSSAAATYRNEVDVISKGLPVGREYQGAPMKGMSVKDHATFNQNAMGDAAERLLKSLSKDHSMEEIFELLQQPDFQRELGLFDPTMVKSDAAKLTYLKLVAQFKQRAWNASNKAKTEGQRIKANVLYRQVSQYYANLTTGGGQYLQSIQDIHDDPRSRFAFEIERYENAMTEANAEAVENQAGPEGMNPVKSDITTMINTSGENATADVLEDVEEDLDASLFQEGESSLTGEAKSIWEKLKDFLRIRAALIRRKAAKVGNKAKASLSRSEYDKILSMSDEEADALEAQNEKNIMDALKKLDSMLTGDQKGKVNVAIGIATIRAGKGQEIEPEESSDPTMRDVLREINKARREIPGANQKPIQWAEILRQSPKSTEKTIGTEEYRKRIFDAMMASDAFKDMSDEQKGKIADLFSEAWEKKRTAILDKMLEQYSTDLEAAKEKRKLAKALKDSRNQLLELVNLGAYNNDELVRAIGERFGLKTEFTAEEKAKLNDLADKLQDDTLNQAKKNKLGREYLSLLQSASGVPASELLSNFWVSSVLTGGNTIVSIGLSFANGFYVIMGNHIARAWTELARGNYQVAADIMIDTFKSMAKWLKAYAPSAERAWNYLWSGDVSLLESAANDPFNNVRSLADIERYQMTAEKLANDPKKVKRYIGRYLRFVGRLLTALDAFNVMTTKAGSLAIAMRQTGLTSEQIKEIDAAHDMAVFKKRIIETDPFFKGQKPTDSFGRAYLHSLAEAEMYASLAKMGVQIENADYMAAESAFTMNPTGVGGIFYNFVKGIDAKATNFTKDFVKRAEAHWAKEKNWDTGWEMFLAHLAQFLSYQVVNAFGLRFARFAGNKFNQGLSFIPGVGLLRRRELSNELLKGREQAFIDSIRRNQIAGLLLGVAGVTLLRSIVDEPDDEKRGWAINGGFNNLTPDQKRQKLARGEKEYTIRIGDLVWNYQNWPISQPLAAVGAMSDMIRFSPDKWKEKGLGDKLMSGALSGLKATLEIPALTQVGELLGTGVSSKDPTEQTQNRLVRALAGWSGGFMPRFLKDIDYMAEPTMRKYETFWQKTSSHIPVYRRYTGKDFYDILGNPVEKNAIPGSREFAKLDERPEYQILGALNSRGIWLTPANAEYRMIGKGRNRRRLTQEEADKYSLESGKEYRKMLIRYGARALRMPPEKAKDYISDLADKARDRALDRVARR